MPSSLVDDEFTDLYATFVDDGGLDRTVAVDEDWERKLRQRYYCDHHVIKAKCSHCSTNRRAIGPDGYYPS